jgi:hypothetical protein
MAIFGLSPLILSLFASSFFTDSQQNLDVAGFTTFLAILTGVVHVIGAINLNVEPQPELVLPVAPTATEPPLDPVADSETTPLLNHKTTVINYDRAWDLMCDYHFWVLAIIVLLTLGSVSTDNLLFVKCII